MLTQRHRENRAPAIFGHTIEVGRHGFRAMHADGGPVTLEAAPAVSGGLASPDYARAQALLEGLPPTFPDIDAAHEALVDAHTRSLW